MMRFRLTDQIIDDRMADRPIKRLSSYYHRKDKMEWLCLIEECGHIWKAVADSVINQKTGCPRCANRITIPEIDIDPILQARNIQRLEPFSNMRQNKLFLCLVCKYKWLTSTSHIISDGSGCPRCVGKDRHTNATVDLDLEGRNITRLGEVYNVKTPTDFRCDVCQYVWATTLNLILNHTKGCPNCAGNAPLTNEIFDRDLIGRPIKRLEDIINAKTPILVQCLIDDCGHKWKTTPSHIRSGNGGCPKCSFGKNERLVYDYLCKYGIKFDYQFLISKLDHQYPNYKVDFYLTEYNTIIEYDGAQHFGPIRFGGISKEVAKENFVKQSFRDNRLAQICQDRNIKLVRIDGRQYKDEALVSCMNTIIETLKGNK